MLFLQKIRENKLNYAVKGVCLVLGVFLAIASIQLWVSSGILLLIPFLLLGFWKGREKLRDFLVVLVFLLVIVWQLPNMIMIGMHGQLIGENIPLLGLVFVLHILHFYKRIPQPFLVYGLCLLVVGALKTKFMFLAVPFLLMGLLDKELKEGLSIPKLKIERIPVLAFCVLFSVGWVFMGVSAYPTGPDVQEMKEAIKLSEDLNIPLYNDWGDGWMLISLGYDANYYMSPPQPDFNTLKRPFVAWSIEEIVGCERISKRTQQCN